MADRLDDHYPVVRIYCDDGEYHAQRGRTWIETLFRMPDPDPNGNHWRAEDVASGRRRRASSLIAMRHRRAAKETALTRDGEVLTDEDRRNTRSREAAVGGGEYRAARQGLDGQEREEYAEEYAAGLDGTRITYPFRCPCRLYVTVKAETLEPILERLYSGGAVEISLSNLGKLVR